MEDYHSTTKLKGDPPGAPWQAADWDDDPTRLASDQRPGGGALLT